MSKSKLNPLIAASTMTAVYMAGLSSLSHAEVYENEGYVDDSSTLPVGFSQNPMFITPEPNSLGQQRYIIQFTGPAVAGVNGSSQFGVIGRDAAGKLDAQSGAAQAYANHLAQQQTSFLDSLSNSLGRQVDALRTFQFAYNGMAVYLSPNEVDAVTNNAQVAAVMLDHDYYLTTDVGPLLIGANNIWGVDGAPDPDIIFTTGFEEVAPLGDFGAGVVIGTLDSGANFDHPSFAAVGGDGFTHVNPLGAGNYLGVCDPSNTAQFDADYTCNAKLIGGYDFVNGLEPPDGFDIPGPEDENGHGSHTASTSGGNMLATAESNGISGISVSGVAPHATHVIFDVCFNNNEGLGLCPGVSSIASVEQAIEDGIVDVINFSIGGGVSPWQDPVSQAFLSATGAGIFVAASAGNSGPGPATLGHVEPWTSSSGASTHNRRFSNDLDVLTPDPVPASLMGLVTVQGTGPVMVTDMTGELRYSGNVEPANIEGCNAYTDGSAFTGAIALISRGACSFADKVNNAVAAGAIGVVVHNNVPGEPIVMGGLDGTTVPSVQVSLTDGLALDAHLDANPGATINVSATTSVNLNGQADSMAGFSSRGPSPFEYNKPDVTGPGVSILAAFSDSDPVGIGTPAEWGAISGTSMSSPHNAGSAALLRDVNPGWSVHEIKSALMMTAITDGVTKEDGITPADPFDRGAGRIQVDIAAQAGLVMDETATNFALANPDTGGDPKTLNVPSITDYRCVETCSFQRAFRSVASGTVTYDASVEGVTGTVTPSTFTISPGQAIMLTVEVDGTASPAGETVFGELVIQEAVVFTPVVFDSPGIDLTITDNGYTEGSGTVDGMVCHDTEVTGITSSTFSASVTLGITHTWLSDLTGKLVNPNGDILTLWSRSTDGGGISMDPTLPVDFFDGAASNPETLGSDGGAFGGDPACTTDPCEFFPFTDEEPTPPSTFAELGVGDPNGTWQLCMGDTAGGDEGILNAVTLNILEGAESTVPRLHLPMVIVGFPPEPEIDVTPTSLTQALDVDATADQVVNIANLPEAGADLNWTIQDDGGTVNVTHVDQVDGTITGGFQSGVYAPDGDIGAYLADDFTVVGNARIENMLFNGFVLADALVTNATAINVAIYADNGGVPAGNPEDGNNAELVLLTLPIADPSLDLTDDNIAIDVVMANGGSALELADGTYWITVFPSMTVASGDDGRWFWFAGGSEEAGNPAHLVAPNSLFGGVVPDWAPLSPLLSPPDNVLFERLNFNITGSTECGATWVSYSATAGTEAVGANTDVTVSFDATGLAPGVYTASICINSNDSDEALFVVPLELTVNAVP